jgi:hypothetical protein
MACDARLLFLNFANFRHFGERENDDLFASDRTNILMQANWTAPGLTGASGVKL